MRRALIAFLLIGCSPPIVASDASLPSDAGSDGADAASVDADTARVDADGTDAWRADAGPTTCGNDRVEEDEACDDGNRIEGDGCSAECMRTPRSCADALALESVGTPTGPNAWRYAFAITEATHAPFRGDPCQLGRDTALLLTVTPAIDGALIVESADPSMGNPTISILTRCDDAFSTLACDWRATSARVARGVPVFVALSLGDTSADVAFRIEPFALEGGSCDYFRAAICAPGLACSNTGGPPACEPSCGDGVVDIGERCDDANRTDGDGCSAACELEAQTIDGFACATTPTPLRFQRDRGGDLVALVEGDTTGSDVRDPSCTTPADASPTVYFAFDIPAGATAQILALGEDGFAPTMRAVTMPCGTPFSCVLSSPTPPGGIDVLTGLVGPGVRTFALSGRRGPGDRGRVRLHVRICTSGIGCT